MLTAERGGSNQRRRLAIHVRHMWLKLSGVLSRTGATVLRRLVRSTDKLCTSGIGAGRIVVSVKMTQPVVGAADATDSVRWHKRALEGK